MSATRWAQLILRTFPAGFRARYGEEMAAHLAGSDVRWSDCADLVGAAAKAWLRPIFVGAPQESRRLRLQATTATVFVAWALGTVAVAVFARAVDDQPVPGLTSWGWTAYQVGNAVFELTGAVLLLLGFAYWLRVVIPAWRKRDRATLRPALLPVIVGPGWLAVTFAVARLAHRIAPGSHRIAAQGPATAGGWALLAVYALFTLGCAVACTASTVRALSRSALPDRLLARSTLVAAPASAGLLAVTAAGTVCLVRVLMVGGLGARNTAMAVVPVGFLLVASAAAVTSALRGVRALRAA